MSDTPAVPVYFEGKTLAELEAGLRKGYLRKSGWIESATRKMSVRMGEPIPRYTYPALEFLEKEIKSDVSLFEYGGGQSTVFWSKRVNRIVSVDHDPRFIAHLRKQLDRKAELHVVEENAALSETASEHLSAAPAFQDPERSNNAFLTGQLNTPFQAYGLHILEYPKDTFDVAIIDGMARNLSTWAALRYLQKDGIIIFDDAEQAYYSQALQMLEDAGYRRIDFSGLGPVSAEGWTTSVFHQAPRFLNVAGAAPVTPEVAAVEQQDKTGIMVIGYNRPKHLQTVLESLKLQGRLSDVHVWIDGTQGRGEFDGVNKETLKLAESYDVAEIHALRSHVGIEKLMLDSLDWMSLRYSRVLVLEDDCFPVEGAIDAFDAVLDEVKNNPNVYSVYGHHFGVEPEHDPNFTRFQGWGWAAHSSRIRALIPELRDMFLMSEDDYIAHVEDTKTKDVVERLDRTPGRDVLNVLKLYFSWDSATAFVTARRGMTHRRTPDPVILNSGIVAGIGHFREDKPWLRKPPFNMVTVDEVWDLYSQPKAKKGTAK
ncbi:MULTISPECIES: hypothetical protein [unclassified Ruegeria]|uniref:hypothetical protein n=1 Tax=unclassified Ruegeria TaxID=2625375 RepID=UPI001488958D|nr:MULTISPECIES: hypothetical protein [unclassified Ruegeria]